MMTRSHEPLVSEVLDHLQDMKELYLTTKNFSAVQLFGYFCDMEEGYVQEKESNNSFCHTVHKLHPKIYRRDMDGYVNKTNPLLFQYAIKSLFHCARCQHQLETEQAFHISMLDKRSETCRQCGTRVTFEHIAVQAFIRKYNANKQLFLQSNNNTITTNLDSFPATLNDTLHCHTWNDIMDTFATAFGGKALFPRVCQEVVLQASNQVMFNATSLGLDLIKGMYRQLVFVCKLCCNFNYWTMEIVLSQAVLRYHRFMQLIHFQNTKNKNKNKTKQITLVPTMDIDLVWHTHQAQCSKYTAYCEELLQGPGRLINHDDTIGTGDLETSYADSFVWWNKHYQEPYSYKFPPSFIAWQRGYRANRNNNNNNGMMNNPFAYAKRLYTWHKYGKVSTSHIVITNPNNATNSNSNRGGEEMGDYLNVKDSTSVIGTPVMEASLLRPRTTAASPPVTPSTTPANEKEFVMSVLILIHAIHTADQSRRMTLK